MSVDGERKQRQDKSRRGSQPIKYQYHHYIVVNQQEKSEKEGMSDLNVTVAKMEENNIFKHFGNSRFCKNMLT